MIALLLASLAFAAEPVDLREELESGAVMNWTRMTIEVNTAAEPSGVDGSRRVVETTARRPIGDKMARVVRGVLVQGELTVGELQTDPDIGQKVASRVFDWAVTESRYFASGRVELTAELELGGVLRPWTMVNAPPAPEAQRQGKHTGVIVLARDIEVRRAFAPRILASDRSVLHPGVVWDTRATSDISTIYVPDPAHPATARAGQSPLFVVALASESGDLLLDLESSIAYRTALQGSLAVGQGTVVVVVDP